MYNWECSLLTTVTGQELGLGGKGLHGVGSMEGGHLQLAAGGALHLLTIL